MVHTSLFDLVTLYITINLKQPWPEYITNWNVQLLGRSMGTRSMVTSDSPKFKLPIVVATSQNKMNNFKHQITLSLIIHSFYNPAIWYCHSLLIVKFSFYVNTIYCHDINIVTFLLADACTVHAMKLHSPQYITTVFSLGCRIYE